jgi:hypothetical protein
MRIGVEARIAELAAAQHGLVTRSQLRKAGLTDRTIDRRLQAKRLWPAHRGVCRVGPLVAPRAREMAAVLACGGRAVVSHRSAAWLWEVGEPPGPSSPVDVWVDESVRVRRAGIRAHRASGLADDDVTTLDRIPVTTLGRTLIDLAPVVGRTALERMAARAERNGLIELDELAARVARSRGRPGIRVLAALIGQEGGVAFTRSVFEERFVDEVRRFALPVPRINARVAGRELDAYWPEGRLAVELDGAAHHASWRSQESDRRRDADLAAHGITVIRVTWRQLVHETGPPWSVSRRRWPCAATG